MKKATNAQLSLFDGLASYEATMGGTDSLLASALLNNRFGHTHDPNLVAALATAGYVAELVTDAQMSPAGWARFAELHNSLTRQPSLF